MLTFTLNNAVSPYRCGDSVGVRVRIECTASVGNDTLVFSSNASKIFAYSRDGHFNHVCNVIDLKECPVDTPSSGKWPLWYRLNYVDLLVPTVEDADDFVKRVESDVEDLHHMIDVYNNLVGLREVTIPKGQPLPEEDENTEENDNGNDSQTG